MQGRSGARRRTNALVCRVAGLRPVVIEILTSRIPSTLPHPSYIYVYIPRVKRVHRAASVIERYPRIHVYRNYVIPPRPDNRRRVFPLGKIGFASGRKGGEWTRRLRLTGENRNGAGSD